MLGCCSEDSILTVPDSVHHRKVADAAARILLMCSVELSGSEGSTFRTECGTIAMGVGVAAVVVIPHS